jgi:hypothetical protein
MDDRERIAMFEQITNASKYPEYRQAAHETINAMKLRGEITEDIRLQLLQILYADGRPTTSG